MRILFDISDPADVHLFKNTIKRLHHDGHAIRVTAREKEVNALLLHHENIPFITRGAGSYSLFGKGLQLLWNDLFLIKQARDFCPDIIVGSHNPYVTHTGKMLGIPSLIFSDSEHAHLQNVLMYPFATHICIPACYYDPVKWSKVHRYNGYHSLSYLHPSYFTPDKSVLEEANIAPDEPYAVIRFIAWTANHDYGNWGIPDKIQFVKELAKHVRVIISAEDDLPDVLKPFHLPVAPWRLHDLLYFATLYVGEGATIASESAVLGTHALYVNTMKVGYTIEQEKKYHLVTNFHDRQTDFSEILKKALSITQYPGQKEKCRARREQLLADTIDVTEFIVNTITNIAYNKDV